STPPRLWSPARGWARSTTPRSPRRRCGGAPLRRTSCSAPGRRGRDRSTSPTSPSSPATWPARSRRGSATATRVCSGARRRGGSARGCTAWSTTGGTWSRTPGDARRWWCPRDRERWALGGLPAGRGLEHPAVALQVLDPVAAPVRLVLRRREDPRAGLLRPLVVGVHIGHVHEHAVDDPGHLCPRRRGRAVFPVPAR